MPNTLKIAMNKFNDEIVKIYHENPSVPEMLKSANSMDYLGPKCFSYLALKDLNCKLFELPNSILVPMTLPVSFGVRNAVSYLTIKELFKSIDNFGGKNQISELRSAI